MIELFFGRIDLLYEREIFFGLRYLKVKVIDLIFFYGYILINFYIIKETCIEIYYY